MSTTKQTVLLTSGMSKIVTFGSGGQTPAGNSYMYLVGDLAGSSGREVKGIYAFSLPFSTELHLVGVPNGEAGKSWVASPTMEPVVLEGNYQSYFSLYAEDGQQSLSRYHIDPQAMVFSADFCSKFHWEIVNNTLYFLDEELLTSLEVADEFIRIISPAFHQEKPQNVQLFVTQVGEDLRESHLSLQCPVCSTELMEGLEWLACPAGHGYLMSGTQMLDVRKDSAHIIKKLSEIRGRPPKVISQVADAPHNKIDCPHCQHEMLQTKFQNTDIVLDICTYCPYRWIDGVELDAVLGKYRHEVYE